MLVRESKAVICYSCPCCLLETLLRMASLMRQKHMWSYALLLSITAVQLYLSIFSFHRRHIET